MHFRGPPIVKFVIDFVPGCADTGTPCLWAEKSPWRVFGKSPVFFEELTAVSAEQRRERVYRDFKVIT